MTAPTWPQIVFKPNAQGLFVPRGFQVGGKFLPDRRQTTPGEVAAFFGERTISIEPDYSELWPNETKPDIPTMLKRFKRTTWFGYISRFLQALHNKNVPTRQAEESIIVGMMTKATVDRINAWIRTVPKFRLLSPFAMLVTQQLCFIYCEDGVDAERLTEEEREHVLKTIYLVSEFLHEKPNAALKAEDSAGVAAALADRSELPDAEFFGLRALSLWCWKFEGLSEESKAIRKKANECFKGQFGVTLEQWLFTLWAQIISFSRNFDLEQNITGIATIVKDIAPTEFRQTALIKSLAADSETFAKRCKQAHSEEEPIWSTPDLKPTSQYPLLEYEEGKAAVLSPNHLALAALERPLWVMRGGTDGKGKDKLSNPYQGFGYLIQDYVNWHLNRMYPGRYTPLDPLKNRNRADGIIWFEDAFIVVEIKGRHTRNRHLVRTDSELLIELLDKGIRDAVGQIEETVRDVIKKRIPYPYPTFKPVKAGSLIIVSEELPLSVLAEKVWRQVLPPTRIYDGIKQLHPQIVDLSEIELFDMFPSVSLFDVLNNKMLDDARVYEGLASYRRLVKIPMAARSELNHERIDSLRTMLSSFSARRKRAFARKSKNKSSKKRKRKS